MSTSAEIKHTHVEANPLADESGDDIPMPWPHGKLSEAIADALLWRVRNLMKNKENADNPKTIEEILKRDMPYVIVRDPNTNKRRVFAATARLFEKNEAEFDSLDPIESGRLVCLGEELPSTEIDHMQKIVPRVASYYKRGNLSAQKDDGFLRARMGAKYSSKRALTIDVFKFTGKIAGLTLAGGIAAGAVGVGSAI